MSGRQLSLRQRLRRWLRRSLRRDREAAAEPPPPVTIPRVVIERPGSSRLAAERAAAGQDMALSTEHAVALRTAMLNQLDTNDLAAVAAALEIDAAALTGGKGRQVLALMQAAQRAGRLNDLVAACAARRPDYDWSTHRA